MIYIHLVFVWRLRREFTKGKYFTFIKLGPEKRTHGLKQKGEFGKLWFKLFKFYLGILWWKGQMIFMKMCKRYWIVQLRLFPAAVMIHCHLTALEYNWRLEPWDKSKIFWTRQCSHNSLAWDMPTKSPDCHESCSYCWLNSNTDAGPPNVHTCWQGRRREAHQGGVA